MPHAVDKVVPIGEVLGTPIHQVVIGTCNAARESNLAEAARILRGKRIAPGVRLVVTPSSRDTMLAPMKSGVLAILVEAGAVIATPGCSGCAGGCHFAVPDVGEPDVGEPDVGEPDVGEPDVGEPDVGENVLSTANRNFKGHPRRRTLAAGDDQRGAGRRPGRAYPQAWNVPGDVIPPLRGDGGSRRFRRTGQGAGLNGARFTGRVIAVVKKDFSPPISAANFYFPSTPLATPLDIIVL